MDNTFCIERVHDAELLRVANTTDSGAGSKFLVDSTMNTRWYPGGQARNKVDNPHEGSNYYVKSGKSDLRVPEAGQ
jgi:hypothetical protein